MLVVSFIEIRGGHVSAAGRVDRLSAPILSQHPPPSSDSKQESSTLAQKLLHVGGIDSKAVLDNQKEKDKIESTDMRPPLIA